MNGESVWPRLLEAIEDGGWVDEVSGPYDVECLDVSTERCEGGEVRGYEFGASDVQGLVEMCTSATNPCPGHERCLYESFWVIVKETNDAVHQFSRQVHLGWMKGTGGTDRSMLAHLVSVARTHPTLQASVIV